MKQAKILVVGSLAIDYSVLTTRFPLEGETVVDGVYSKLSPGGKGANQAVQAARLTADVTMVGRIGEDGFGRAILESLEDAKIRTEHIVTDEENPTGTATIILEQRPDGGVQNRIIMTPGANMAMEVEDVRFVEKEIGDYGIVMLQHEIPAKVNEYMIDMAYANGVPVLLNPAPARPLKKETLEKLDYIAPNETETTGITGYKVRENGKLDVDELKKAARYFIASGVKNVIVTLGDIGVYFMDADKDLHIPAVESVECIDPTAAGDSFVGTFAAFVASNSGTIDEALSVASHSAAITVSRNGAQEALPTLDELMAYIKNKYIGDK